MKIIKYTLACFILLLLVAITLMTNLSGIPAPATLPEFVPELHQTAQTSTPPERITLQITATPDTSIMIHWRTDTGVNASEVQIYPANATKDLTEHWSAKSRMLQQNNQQNVHHQTEVTGLQPATEYHYRVGDGATWSDWFSFTTASSQPEPFSFTFFGDIQEGLNDIWPAILRQAQATAPQSAFNLFVGDLVDNSPDDHQWQAFFNAIPDAFTRQPMAATPGNHEYDGGIQEREWAAHFRFPANGPANNRTLDNSSYYFDYQGARFISLNTNIIRGLTFKDTLNQRSWLKSLLKNNPNQWTIVFQHLPVLTSIKGEDDSPELKLLYAPVYKKYGVDLVLQGDEHTYARGQRTATDNQLESPVYIIANSGSKTQEVAADWADITVENTPLFQIVSIAGNTLSYQSVNRSGEIFDAFELHTQKGKTVIYNAD